jgi:hypothetical protein
MSVRTLFATRLYQAVIDDERLFGELGHSIRTFAVDDEAGSAGAATKAIRATPATRRSMTCPGAIPPSTI